MAKAITEDQVAAMPDPNAPEPEEPKVVQTKAQALEAAVYAIQPAYVALQEAFDNGASDADIHALMLNLGREAGRVRRAVRLVQKAAKAQLNADGDLVEVSDEDRHKALHVYNLANPTIIEPKPRKTKAAVADDDDDDDIDETEALDPIVEGDDDEGNEEGDF